MTFLKKRSLILLSIACILINLYILHAWGKIPQSLRPSSLVSVPRNPTREEYLGWFIITQISPWVFFFSGWTGIILGIYSAKRDAGRLNAYFFLA
ncbi:MAG: hypothetical protein ACRC62_02285, partial [Microcoleus sp.]